MIRSPDSDFEIVLNIMKNSIGKSKAITIERITDLAGFFIPDSWALSKPDRRRTELVLQTRRGDFPRPVLSCGRGVFMAKTAAEANEYFRTMNHRHAAQTDTMVAVRNKMKQAGFVQVGPWEFADPPAAQKELTMAIL